ncbi:MAG: hypothetical protein E8D45_04305 [Nitrospira sp.]|nr:MAG: hypothetical protein E8D45_04305 [Nitrospira sp.]
MSRIARHLTLLRALALIAFVVSGFACAVSQDSDTGKEGGSRMDRAAFVAELKKAGHVVESKGPVVQPFMSIQGLFLGIDGNDVQTFEYASETAAKTEAGKIAPDGSTVGDTRIAWVEPPHFFRKEKLLVLYVGVDRKVRESLEFMLGPQIAGE